MGLGRSLKKAGRKLDKGLRKAGRDIEDVAKGAAKDPEVLLNPAVALADPRRLDPKFTTGAGKKQAAASLDLPELSIEPIRGRKPGLAATILTSGLGLTDDDDDIRRPLLLGGRGRIGRVRS